VNFVGGTQDYLKASHHGMNKLCTYYGRGAIISVQVNRLHPSDIVANLDPNPQPKQRVEGLVVTGKGEHNHRSKKKDVLWLTFWVAKNRQR
jgi:hypothetical protein